MVVGEEVESTSLRTSADCRSHIPLFSCATHELMHARVRSIVRVLAQLSERACRADEAPRVSKISAASSAVSRRSSQSSERISRSSSPTPSGTGTRISRRRSPLTPPGVGEVSVGYSRRFRAGVEGGEAVGSSAGITVDSCDSSFVETDSFATGQGASGS